MNEEKRKLDGMRAQSQRVTLTSCMDEMRHAHNLSLEPRDVVCAMSVDDDARLNKN